MEIKRVVIYARTATREIGTFHRLVEQVDCCEACIGKHVTDGWHLRDLMIDYGYSGASLRRPALMKMLAMCRDGGVDVIAVWDRERLARRLYIAIKLDRLFRRYNIDVVYVNAEAMVLGEQGSYMAKFAQAQMEYEGMRPGRRLPRVLLRRKSRVAVAVAAKPSVEVEHTKPGKNRDRFNEAEIASEP